MKKVISVFLAVLMIAALSVPTTYAAAAPVNGTVTVNSHWTDGSVKQITVSNWQYKNNASVEFSGTFKVVFPRGYTKTTPTVAEAWTLFQNSMGYANGNYDVTYKYDGNGNGAYIYNGYNYVYVGEGNGDYAQTGSGLYTYVGYQINWVSANTAAETEALTQLKTLREVAEDAGWSVDWSPSKSVKPTETRAWFAVTICQLQGSDTVTSYQLSMLTEKANGKWVTLYKTYQSGKEYSSQTYAQVRDMLQTESNGRAVNVFNVRSPRAAADAMVDYLRSLGYAVTTQEEGTFIGTDFAILRISLGEYNKTAHTVVMRTEKRTGTGYRATLTDAAGNNIATKDVILHSF